MLPLSAPPPPTYHVTLFTRDQRCHDANGQQTFREGWVGEANSCLLDATVLFSFCRAGAADSVAIVIVICFWCVHLNIGCAHAPGGYINSIVNLALVD